MKQIKSYFNNSFDHSLITFPPSKSLGASEGAWETVLMCRCWRKPRPQRYRLWWFHPLSILVTHYHLTAEDCKLVDYQACEKAAAPNIPYLLQSWTLMWNNKNAFLFPCARWLPSSDLCLCGALLSLHGPMQSNTPSQKRGSYKSLFISMLCPTSWRFSLHLSSGQYFHISKS